MPRSEQVIVHTLHDGQRVVLHGRRDDDALGAGLEVPLGFFVRLEVAGGFHHDVDAEFLPRTLRRVALAYHADFFAVHGEVIAAYLNVSLQAAMQRVVLEQVRAHIARRRGVHADDLDLVGVVFDELAVHIAADAAVPVDGDLQHELMIHKTLSPSTRWGQEPAYRVLADRCHKARR